MSVPSSCPAGQRGSTSQHVAVWRRVMVFLDLIHMLMTVPTLSFSLCPPSDTLWLLLELPAPDQGFCSWQRRQAGAKARADGESKRSKDGGKAKGGGKGNRRKAPMIIAGRGYDCKRSTTCLGRASASGLSRSFSYSRKGGSTRE